MVTLAFDGRTGASGDMLLGALLAAGADRSALDVLERELTVRYDVAETTRCGISATRVEVVLADESTSHDRSHDQSDGGHSQDHSHDQSDGGRSQDHSHDHSDEVHSHKGTEGHAHEHTHAEGHGPERSYGEVVDLVESMGLSAAVEDTALAIFELLGEAEASVHGTDLESTQFHEVGADDAIADVVGVALLLADLDPDRVVTTPLATGGGEVSMSHGVYPVPTPAVVELAERADWSLQGGPLETELLTPTGAAVLAHVAAGVERLPPLNIEQSGYGAGAKSFDRQPNVLRAVVGEEAERLRQEPITVLETNLDDASPEIVGSLQETLVDAGALDVTVVPTTMKKSRPGHLLKVIVPPADAAQVARALAAQTGTLGVREHGSGHRFVADRSVESVTVDVEGRSHELDVKIGRFGGDPGEVFDVSAEYDDALRVASETDLPVREVCRRAENRARSRLL